MTTYAWTTDDDEIALDAIIVGIGDDAPALIAAGMTPAEPLANVYWPDWISQGDKINAAMEGPYPVAEALERAEILCAVWAYERVVISLQDRATWRREWGELREVEGLD
ncbi:hypothetical protein [Devosia beringensis]|uniref:hypothetical protein n=1 Tax=Devosia beringensis TaxID=2657486 RepID=UPI00186B8F97|nr:hypothetical protein [Devosia beringensis]